MLLPVDQIRFYQSCNSAMFGYASAMTAASGIVGSQVISFWSEALAPGSAGGVARRPARGSRSTGARSVNSRNGVSRIRARLRVRPEAPDEPMSAMAEAMGNWCAMPWLGAGALAKDSSKNRFGPNASAFGSGHMGAMPGMQIPGMQMQGAPMPFGLDPAMMMSAWLNMDYSRSPAAWPMAMGMMSAGVPRMLRGRWRKQTLQ